jgi:hypothetical protein
VIGAAVLVAGLLLIVTAFAAASIPGGALFTPSGIRRSPETAADAAGDDGTGADATGGLFSFASRTRHPIRAFVFSPFHPTTWFANAAIALGLFVGVGAFAVIATLASIGLSILLAGIGVVFIAIAIEASRLVARIERRRAFIGEAVRPPPHRIDRCAAAGSSASCAASSRTRAAGAMCSTSRSTCHCR